VVESIREGFDAGYLGDQRHCFDAPVRAPGKIVAETWFGVSKKCAFAIGLIVMGSPHVSAKSADLSDDLKNKVSSFSMELTQCYAYCSMVSHCAEVSDAPDVAQKSEAIAQNIMPSIYETGKMAGLIDSALLGRIQMLLDSMKADIANSCANIGTLYREYALSCKSIVENPEARLRVILGR
jgi:hypothetical protein